MSKRNRVPNDVYIKRLFQLQNVLIGFYIERYGVPDPDKTEGEEQKKIATGIGQILQESANLAMRLGLIRSPKDEDVQHDSREVNDDAQELQVNV
jgi:hypothetical protein